jgi:hypothetical protein
VFLEFVSLGIGPATDSIPNELTECGASVVGRLLRFSQIHCEGLREVERRERKEGGGG